MGDRCLAQSCAACTASTWPRFVHGVLPRGHRPVSDSDEEKRLKTYMCVICGYVYDEAKGAPDEGIEPGTRWEDVPLNWQCPECGAGKDDFELMEI